MSDPPGPRDHARRLGDEAGVQLLAQYVVQPVNVGLNFLDLLQEFRVVREVAQFAGRAWTWPIAQRADRARSILLIPGFMAGDQSLTRMAVWLRTGGFVLSRSGIRWNAGCMEPTVESVAEARVLEAFPGAEEV